MTSAKPNTTPPNWQENPPAALFSLTVAANIHWMNDPRWATLVLPVIQGGAWRVQCPRVPEGNWAEGGASIQRNKLRRFCRRQRVRKSSSWTMTAAVARSFPNPLPPRLPRGHRQRRPHGMELVQQKTYGLAFIDYRCPAWTGWNSIGGFANCSRRGRRLRHRVPHHRHRLSRHRRGSRAGLGQAGRLERVDPGHRGVCGKTAVRKEVLGIWQGGSRAASPTVNNVLHSGGARFARPTDKASTNTN